MVAIDLRGMFRQASDDCDICHRAPFSFVLTITFKPEHRKKHPENPRCECDTKPLKAHLCLSCKDDAVKCAEGTCEEGKNCEVESLIVQTEVEAVDEALAGSGIEWGIPAPILRFAYCYRMAPEEGQTVVRALAAYGVSVDFTKLRPEIGTRVRTTGGSGGNSPSANVPADMAAEPGEPAEDGGDHQPAAWPKPVIALRNDGNVH